MNREVATSLDGREMGEACASCLLTGWHEADLRVHHRESVQAISAFREEGDLDSPTSNSGCLLTLQ